MWSSQRRPTRRRCVRCGWGCSTTTCSPACGCTGTAAPAVLDAGRALEALGHVVETDWPSPLADLFGAIGDDIAIGVVQARASQVRWLERVLGGRSNLVTSARRSSPT